MLPLLVLCFVLTQRDVSFLTPRVRWMGLEDFCLEPRKFGIKTNRIGKMGIWDLGLLKLKMSGT